MPGATRFLDTIAIMPTIMTHALVGAAATKLTDPKAPPSLYIAAALCAMVPDLDVIGLLFGIEPGSLLGHRGLSHSLSAALSIGVAASRLKGLPTKSVWFLAAVTASHGILDAFTSGGRGIAFLSPFSNERFFAPWRPILVSPIGTNFFSPRGIKVLMSEFTWICVPILLILFASEASGRLDKK